MLKKVLSSLAIISLVLICVLSPLKAIADFGDYSGGDDYGYSDYSSDYGDYSSDYGGGYSGGYGSGSYGMVEYYSMIFVAVVFVAWLIYKYYFKKPEKGGSSRKGPVAPGAAPTTGLWPMDTIKNWDPNFSEDAMKERLSNLYVQMQNCWTANDISPLRGDFTDAQFAQYDRQLDKYRQEGISNVVDRIAVLDVSLMGIKQDAEHDILIANVYARITTYSIKIDTEEIVRGDKNKEKFMKYEWTLVRPLWSQTQPEEQSTTAVNCPNCGAALNINKSAKCPYCDSVVTKPNYKWVIAGIKGLSQRTR